MVSIYDTINHYPLSPYRLVPQLFHVTTLDLIVLTFHSQTILIDLILQLPLLIEAFVSGILTTSLFKEKVLIKPLVTLKTLLNWDQLTSKCAAIDSAVPLWMAASKYMISNKTEKVTKKSFLPTQT